jgi:hypothetical protein
MMGHQVWELIFSLSMALDGGLTTNVITFPTKAACLEAGNLIKADVDSRREAAQRHIPRVSLLVCVPK